MSKMISSYYLAKELELFTYGIVYIEKKGEANGKLPELNFYFFRSFY